MSFFNEPRIKQIAKQLRSNIDSYYRSAHENTLFLDSIGGPAWLPQSVGAWLFSKEIFSWKFDLYLFLYIDANPEHKLKNAKGQKDYYGALLAEADNIVSELNKPVPNYSSIFYSATQLKKHSASVPSVIGIEEIKLTMTYFSGGNLFTNFFGGIGGLIGAPIFALASLFLIPVYLNGNSEYCGSAQFFLDTASYFCASIWNVIASVIFPLAMLQAQYETGSCNVIKGNFMRSIDSIISLVAEENVKSLESPVISQTFSS